MNFKYSWEDFLSSITTIFFLNNEANYLLYEKGLLKKTSSHEELRSSHVLSQNKKMCEKDVTIGDAMLQLRKKYYN